VLDCITDREAAVQLAFASLEKKYHWMVNLVCTGQDTCCHCNMSSHVTFTTLLHSHCCIDADGAGSRI